MTRRRWIKIHDTPGGLRYFAGLLDNQDVTKLWECPRCGWIGSAEPSGINRRRTCPECWNLREALIDVTIRCSIAIADRSGATPDRTDDGVIWLDPSMPIVVRLGAPSFSLPVIVERRASAAHVVEPYSALEDVLRLWKATGGRVSIVGVGREGLRLLGELAKWEDAS